MRGGRGGGRGGRGAAGVAVRYREGREGAALSARRALSSPRPLLAAVQCRLASKRNSRPLHDLYSATRPRRRRPRARRPLGRRQGRAAGGLRRAALRPSGLRACTRPARRCREADSLADRSADVSAVEQTSSRTTARSLPSCTPGTPALRCRSCAMYVLTCGGAKETVSREMEMEHDRDSYSWLSLRFGLPLFFVSQNAMPAEAAGGDGVLAVAGRGEGRENKWACARRSACYELRCLLLLSPPPPPPLLLLRAGRRSS